MSIIKLRKEIRVQICDSINQGLVYFAAWAHIPACPLVSKLINLATSANLRIYTSALFATFVIGEAWILSSLYKIRDVGATGSVGRE